MQPECSMLEIILTIRESDKCRHGKINPIRKATSALATGYFLCNSASQHWSDRIACGKSADRNSIIGLRTLVARRSTHDRRQGHGVYLTCAAKTA